MKTIVPVEHYSLKIVCKYEDFTQNQERLLGRFDPSALEELYTNPKAAEERIAKIAGEEDLMLFQALDHGGLLVLYGKARKAKQYVLGNPLTASQMTRHDIRAGLYAPLRLLVFEGEDG